MKDFAELISALASLLWPIFAFVALVTFKKEVGRLIDRLRKGKLLGQEIELGESLNKLEKSATAVAEEVAALPPATTEESTPKPAETEDLIAGILREAARNPRAALLLLASELEREARQLLASVGHLKERSIVPLAMAVDVLQKQFGGLPGHIPSSLKLFWEVRNRIVHGGQAENEEILRAVDSGITILKAIRALPRETNYVYHPGVPIYQDADCTNPWPIGNGVILETETPGGTQRFFRIFPSTKTHFKKGRKVAWEWNLSTVWKEAWYRDPDSGEIRPAWNSAGEFVGRHLDEV